MQRKWVPPTSGFQHMLSLSLSLSFSPSSLLVNTHLLHLINSFLSYPIHLLHVKATPLLVRKKSSWSTQGKKSLDSCNIPYMLQSDTSYTISWQFTCLFLQLNRELLEGRNFDLLIFVSLVTSTVPGFEWRYVTCWLKEGKRKEFFYIISYYFLL